MYLYGHLTKYYETKPARFPTYQYAYDSPRGDWVWRFGQQSPYGTLGQNHVAGMNPLLRRI